MLFLIRLIRDNPPLPHLPSIRELTAGRNSEHSATIRRASAQIRAASDQQQTHPSE